MERVTQEDKEEVAIFLKEYGKINNKFIKIKFISNNLRFSSYLSVKDKDSHVEKIYLLLEDESFRKILECDLKLSDLILFSKQYYMIFYALLVIYVSKFHWFLYIKNRAAFEERFK